MLGKHLDITVYGAICGGQLLSGYINNKEYSGKTVYIVTREKPREEFKGIIIAVLSIKGSKEDKLIVTPEGEFFYEPEIRQRLSALKGVIIADLTCLYEKSCGAVVVYRSDQGIRVLLVKNHNGKYWSFPKGHIEKGESEKQTAIREIKEETGLNVFLYDDFRQISDYCPFGKIKKRVIFFLAETKNDIVKKQEDEIDSYFWASFPQAFKMCTYDNDLRVLTKAQRTLQIYDAKN